MSYAPIILIVLGYGAVIWTAPAVGLVAVAVHLVVMGWAASRRRRDP